MLSEKANVDCEFVIYCNKMSMYYGEKSLFEIEKALSRMLKFYIN